jgi:hypothetical protein
MGGVDILTPRLDPLPEIGTAVKLLVKEDSGKSSNFGFFGIVNTFL